MSGHKNLPKENGNLGRKKKVLPSSILSVSVEPGLCVEPGTGRAVPAKLLFDATSYRIASRSSFKINKNKKTKRYSLIESASKPADSLPSHFIGGASASRKVHGLCGGIA